MIDCEKNGDDKHATTVEDQDQTKEKDLDPTQDKDPRDGDPKYTDQVLNRATFTGGSAVVSNRTPSLC